MTDTRSTTRFARPVAATLAAAVALGGVALGAGPAAAAPAAPAAPVSVEEFCAAVPTTFDRFDDAVGNTFASEIDCLAVAGITAGVGPGARPGRSAFAPGRPVTRGQMASFIARLMDTATNQDTEANVKPLPEFDGVNTFTDTAGDTHVENINRLARVGIAVGGPGGLPADRFAPGASVTRGQMATFIARSVEHLADEKLPVWGQFFTDSAGSVHAARINQVARLGIAVGNNGRFSPDAPLNRGQMAAFLTRTLAWAMQEGRIAPLFADVSDEHSGVTTVDNLVGTASHTFTVLDAEQRPVTGLRPQDFSFRIGRQVANVNALVRSAPATWSFSEVEPGVYRLVESSPEPLTRTYTDLSVRRVVIEASLTITITPRGITAPGT